MAQGFRDVCRTFQTICGEDRLSIHTFRLRFLYAGADLIALLQRVNEASVRIDGDTVGAIGGGLLVLTCAERGDTNEQAARMAERVLGYRVFPDGTGRMNASVADVRGGVLLVPQFTLAADTRKGTRPSLGRAAPPDTARALFECFVERVRECHEPVATGRFGAYMQVALVNDGPVTFWLEARPQGRPASKQTTED